MPFTPGPPSGPIGSYGTPADPNELLRRIESNTANLLWWMKLLVAAVVVLVLVNLLFIA